MSIKNGRLYEFGNFRVNASERILFRDSEALKLPPKTFDLLLILVCNCNRVISKDELMREIWANSFVEDANLTVHISALRKIFGVENSNYIETVPKHGYRFNATVKEINFEESVLKNENSNHNQNEIAAFQSQKIEPSQEISKNPFENQTLQLAETEFTVKSPDTPNNEETFRRNFKKDNRNKNKFLFAAVILILIFGVSGFTLFKLFNSPALSQAMKIERILDTGKTFEAAISPDGKYLAQIVRESGKQSLQIKHIGTNSSVQLLPPAAVSFSPLTFSNDGGYIYYVLRQTSAPDKLYQIAMLGGEPKNILEDVAGAISFAPDNRRFAFVRHISPEETALMIGDLSGGEERQLASRGKPEYFHPSGAAWSPDGHLIALSGGSASGERLSNIFIVSVKDGAMRTLSNRKWRAVERLAWLADGHGLIAAAMDVQGQETFQIWEFPFPEGEPRRITNDLNDYGSLSLTADSKTIVTIQSNIRRNIWVVPDVEKSEAKSLTDDMNDAYRFVAWTPDKKIIYPSLVSGNRDIWIMNADGSNRKQLTATAHNDILPVASPDGRFIVFASNRSASGTVNIWRMNTDGTNLIQLTYGSDESLPSCTPDGKWVVYVAGGNDGEMEKRTIWKVPIEGGESIQLTTNSSYGAQVSPDGTQFVCRYREAVTNSWKIALISTDGGQPTRFVEAAPNSPLRWTSDGSAITFIKTQTGVSNIWSQSLNNEPPKQLTDFKSEQIHYFDWSNDNQLVCSRGTTTQEAILINNFR